MSAPREREAGGRHLLLLRHAKAAPADPGGDDHERPLAPRGRRDAARMAAEIERRGLAPEQVLCSTARRTRETLELVLPHLPAGPSVAVDRALYLASAEQILRRIATLGNRTRALLVVGHNPGLAELALLLARRGASSTTARMAQKFPTGALALLRFPTGASWDLAPHTGILDAFATPREIAADEG